MASIPGVTISKLDALENTEEMTIHKKSSASTNASSTILSMAAIKFFIIAVAILLCMGCPGPGDRMISRESTPMIIKDGQPCVLSPLKPGEQITAVQIYSDQQTILHRIFDARPIHVDQGLCLPLFDAVFVPGQHYLIAYDVTSDLTPPRLIISYYP